MNYEGWDCREVKDIFTYLVIAKNTEKVMSFMLATIDLRLRDVNSY